MDLLLQIPVQRILKKTEKVNLPYDGAVSTPWHMSQGLNRFLFSRVHCCSSHNSQEMEMA